jgi:hypothetical protein
VLSLAERLRADGVDAQIDQYVQGTPLEGWIRWIRNQLASADFILLVCTETYYRRFCGQGGPGQGRGVDWEGMLVTLELYHAQLLESCLSQMLASSSGLGCNHRRHHSRKPTSSRGVPHCGYRRDSVPQ